MKKWIAGVAALVLSISLVGCGATNQPAPTPGTTSTPAAPTAPAFKVGLATDVGGLNDQSFNAAANAGIIKAEKDLGITKQVIESTKQDDYVPNLSGLADGGANLVWGIGFLMHDALDSVAKSHPNTKFAIIDSVVSEPNVASVTFREQEGSFLVGVIAAKATKTKKVGFVGGMTGDLIGKFEAGFKAGVKSVDPTITVTSVYAGSFTDDAKGKQIATQMYGQGIDVIYHASGATGKGVIEAAKTLNKYAIGVDSDQNSLAPQNVITSMMKRVDVAVFDVTKQAQAGTFAGGKSVELGLKEDGVGYSATTLWSVMPAGTQALVDKYAAAIKAGTIVVPTKPADADSFKPVQP